MGRGGNLADNLLFGDLNKLQRLRPGGSAGANNYSGLLTTDVEELLERLGKHHDVDLADFIAISYRPYRMIERASLYIPSQHLLLAHELQSSSESTVKPPLPSDALARPDVLTYITIDMGSDGTTSQFWAFIDAKDSLDHAAPEEYSFASLVEGSGPTLKDAITRLGQAIPSEILKADAPVGKLSTDLHYLARNASKNLLARFEAFARERPPMDVPF